ncbi:hypothetical protein ABS71_19190 [bacterium SCN 62-11]|nr:MAG: hypothetical protein ABS71_19190 [bacterium SCN 62-11]
MNLRLSILLWAVLIVSNVGLAQPAARPYISATAAASTPPDGPPYPISIDVTVENRGQAESAPSSLELVTKPSVTAANKPKSDTLTMWDPISQTQPIGALKPGERKVLHFTTIYQCNAAFKNRTGSFKATNIAAAGADVTVNTTVIVKEAPPK